jgi:heme/copper-type cytochrome/quinol oxidase subunit 2
LNADDGFPGTRGLVALIIVVAVILVAAILSVQIEQTRPTQLGAAQSSNGQYSLTLVEVMDSRWNSTLAQPRFYVLGQNGLESSANIRLPVHTPILLTIISYDTPTPGSEAQYAKVSGTVGGTIFIINGTTAMGTSVNEEWGKNVTSVSVASLAHTFSIPQLGINIPVVGGDTELVHLYLNESGTFQWLCLTPCGAEAMSTAGWMEGSVTVG